MDLIETIKRIDTLKKWHPVPPPPPKCPQCSVEFFDTLHVVAIEGSEDTRRVVISAKTRIQLHVWARTLIEEDGTRTLTCKPDPKAAKKK